ncbi:hypothetical protein AV521_27840 [Streptomyces sp. IMTB 2501]|uniref:hypothetical protein n=1 Tax=Streptomyces sp. IMTB 2501 TaxID=1776340 RepID=UPI00096D9325|nr:hypothetical protein [Streptomyces sp. IMTB 2501]OLZ66333.1 hypothetical protein AV521_27840 [Streptomyces sp. IMTB 2501]
MTDSRPVAHGRPGIRRAGPRRPIPHALGLALAATALALTGCSSHAAPASASTSASDSAADTVKNLGAVPIPTPPTAQATPTADDKHLQLVAMGDAVHARLPGVQAVIRASGPAEDLPTRSGSRPPDHTTGTITIRADQVTAPLAVRAGDFSSHDEQGKNVALTATSANSVTASPGHSATLTLHGTFRSGAAELTWRHAGKVIAIWDFNIELD